LVDIATNGAHGVSLAGTGGTNTGVTIRRTNIHGNTQNGINVAMTSNGSAISVANCDVFDNHANGVVVMGAPSGNATNSVVLDTVEVRQHTGNTAGIGKGIWLNGNDPASSNITATIQNSKVHDNRDVGIQIDETMTGGNITTTRETLTGNDVFNNNLNGGAMTPGGISFPTSSTLTTFNANKIHANGGDQMSFAHEPTGGGNWSINAAGACGTVAAGGQNRIYCYTLPGSIGVRTTAPNAAGAYTLDATQVSWANAAAQSGREFVAGTNTTITATGACTAVACNQ
jgi:hypothetical protein